MASASEPTARLGVVLSREQLEARPHLNPSEHPDAPNWNQMKTGGSESRQKGQRATKVLRVGWSSCPSNPPTQFVDLPCSKSSHASSNPRIPSTQPEAKGWFSGSLQSPVRCVKGKAGVPYVNTWTLNLPPHKYTFHTLTRKC